MGDRDSTMTRVVPAFDQLRRLSAPWVERLLALPRTPERPGVRPPETGSLLELRTAPDEMLLPAPASLLRWMLDHAPELPQLTTAGRTSTETTERRQALHRGDRLVLERAQKELAASLRAGGQPPKDWFVLEGPTHVDAFLRCEKAVVVIEGKRTEPGPTTKTEFMEVRHQILRNLDCALEAFPDHAICGFFIVEGDGMSPAVPALWQQACRDTLSRSVLESSLPHRPDAERVRIAQGFLGATTWQAVCAEFGIAFDALPDRAPTR